MTDIFLFYFAVLSEMAKTKQATRNLPIAKAQARAEAKRRINACRGKRLGGNQSDRSARMRFLLNDDIRTYVAKACVLSAAGAVDNLSDTSDIEELD